MINNGNITVTDIQRVIYVRKNNPVGKIDFYTQKNGLPTHELIFRLFGEVKTDFDGKVLKNKKFTIQYLPKGCGNIEYKVETIETGECIDICFDTDKPLSDTAFCIEVNSPVKIKDLFESINSIWMKKDVEYYCDAMSVLYKILSLLKRQEDSIIENPHYIKIKTGVDYLNTNFCDNEINFEYVASLCNMSYSYFRRLFNESMKVSPSKYVINKKIEYAKELLLSKHYNVSEVSDIVGFRDVYYFSHAFKNITGVSPSKLL